MLPPHCICPCFSSTHKHSCALLRTSTYCLRWRCSKQSIPDIQEKNLVMRALRELCCKASSWLLLIPWFCNTYNMYIWGVTLNILFLFLCLSIILSECFIWWSQFVFTQKQFLYNPPEVDLSRRVDLNSISNAWHSNKIVYGLLWAASPGYVFLCMKHCIVSPLTYCIIKGERLWQQKSENLPAS